MRNAHIRILVVLAVITLAGVISTQLYWVNRAVAQQDQVFNYNVQVALRNVVSSLCEANGKDFPVDNPIEQVSSNYFIVRANDRINLQNLEYLITAEIQERSIAEDFEYGVYDCQSDEMVYANDVSLVSLEHRQYFPELKEEEYYFGVYFPQKSRTIGGELDLWKFTTMLTAIVVAFFAYGLFIILKQKRLSEIQRDFVNNVTHELKTPLATLSLASNTLLEKIPGAERRYAEIIDEETNRLKGHVDKILKGAMSDTSIQVTKKEEALDEVVQPLIDRYQEQYRRRMVKWDVKLQKDVVVKTDRDLLDIILTNLVDNAVKYGATEISISASVEGRNYVISVADNGAGIPKEHHKNIYRQFFRVPDEGARHNTKGFGLGLYIVKASVKKLGGKIELSSVPGSGSTFKITFANG